MVLEGASLHAQPAFAQAGPVRRRQATGFGHRCSQAPATDGPHGRREPLGHSTATDLSKRLLAGANVRWNSGVLCRAYGQRFGQGPTTQTRQACDLAA